MTEDTTAFQERLGYRFNDESLLLTALTHPSFASEQSPVPPDNQRLEFLGDAVLQLVSSEMLFETYADMREGKLTKVRSALTKESALVQFARRLELGLCLLLGKGEMRAGGGDRPSNLADAFEAVLAAAYLDGGLPAARTVCRPLIASLLSDPAALLATENPKGALQEHTQEALQMTPVYEVVTVSGPEHRPDFQVRVLVDGEEVACASAGSRRGAERRAAELALAKLRECETDG